MSREGCTLTLRNVANGGILRLLGGCLLPSVSGNAYLQGEPKEFGGNIDLLVSAQELKKEVV